MVTLEDYNGSGELALFGDDWFELNGKFFVGAAVYITGKMRSRFFNSNQKELKVVNVELLQSVKEKAIDHITITVVTDQIDNKVVEELDEIIAEHPGNTQLYFQLRDSLGKNHVLLHSKSKKVDVKHQLIDFIDANPALDYKIN